MHIDISRYTSPYKLSRPVITPSGVEGDFNCLGVDCPVPFRHNGKVYMLHVGFDGKGYQTALCVAEDDSLLRWKQLKVILPRGNAGAWDEVGRAGTTILCDNELFGSREIKKHNGKYWIMYHAYPGSGYEVGPAEIGLAWCEDEDLLDWHCLDKPVYSWKDGEDWEKGGLYKCDLLEHDGKFYMFYNAKNITDGNWREQTGGAVSDDLMSWKRFPGNPCVLVTDGAWDSKFASDPVVLYDSAKQLWVMYYFGYNNKNAQDGIAFSTDLLHWEKHPEPIMRNGVHGEIDSTHAHKPGILYHNGMLYHFYCAVRPTLNEEEKARFKNEYRTISVARSVQW